MQKRRVEEDYFASWLMHDWEILDSIFSESFEYAIEGKNVIIDRQKLKDYWLRNSRRQKELKVFKACLAEEKNWSSYAFCAQFYNKVKGQNQSVVGRIVFRLTDDGKIASLSESYEKYLSPRAKESPAIPGAQLWLKLRGIIAKAEPKPGKLILKALMVFLAISLVTLAVLYLVVEFWATAGLLLSKMTFLDFWKGVELKDAEVVSHLESIKSKFSNILATATPIVFLLQYVRSKLGQVNYIEVHEYENVKTGPAHIMSPYLDGASVATVFSGNFDFLEEQGLLLQALTTLDQGNKLTFFSDKTSDQVTSACAQLPQTRKLLQSLKRKGRIIFSAKTSNIRATYLEKSGVPIVLSNSQDRKKIVAFHGIHDSAALAILCKSLMNGQIEENSKTVASVLPSIERRARYVVIAGETKSGKSHIVKQLVDVGYVPISVSGEMSILSGKKEESRSKLVELGKEIVQQGRQAELLRAIEQKMLDSDFAVIDGLRLPDVITQLKESFGDDLKVIYVTIPPAIQKLRFDEVKGRALEDLGLKAIRASDKFFGVQNTMRLSDLIISGELDQIEIRQRISSHILGDPH